METNALVTGSRKYGESKPHSDTDVVILVDRDTENLMWDKANEIFERDSATFDLGEDVNHKIEFDQVKFVQHDHNPLVRDLRASITFDELGVVCLCVMSEDDLHLLGGIEKWVPTGNKHGGFRSTGRNDRVNFVATSCEERFGIWKLGTETLFDLHREGMSITRDFAKGTFTDFGLPRDHES